MQLAALERLPVEELLETSPPDCIMSQTNPVCTTQSYLKDPY
jgi:hypothetical protein